MANLVTRGLGIFTDIVARRITVREETALASSLEVDGHSAFGPDAGIDSVDFYPDYILPATVTIAENQVYNALADVPVGLWIAMRMIPDAAGGYVTGAIIDVQIDPANALAVGAISGIDVTPSCVSATTADMVRGVGSYPLASTSADVTDLHAFFAGQTLSSSGHADNVYGFYNQPIGIFGGGTVDNFFGVCIADQTGLATNNYGLWIDTPGVYNIGADDNDIYQYNPAFTKYTIGLANYERIAQKWNSNVGEFGVEAGGTGTLRALRLLGDHVQMPNFSEYTEMTPPSAPATNKVRLYCDESAGKTRLMARFATGAVVPVAAEP